MTERQTLVRQADVDDVDALVPLFDAYRQFYGQEESLDDARDFLLERFQRHESSLFIAEDAAGLAVGFAQLYPTFSSVALARTFLLNDLFVVPEARRQGVAKALLSFVAAFCEEVGAARLTLSTHLTNTAAQALYEANGWTRQTDFHVYTREL